jgi:hypothetical protein
MTFGLKIHAKFIYIHAVMENPVKKAKTLVKYERFTDCMIREMPVVIMTCVT